jgi:hypothetical protein
MMTDVRTMTGETIRISAQDRVVAVSVDAPMFGRIATITLDGDQVAELVAALDRVAGPQPG